MRARRWLASTALLFATTALALDKQGSAHGGQLVSTSRDFNVSGALMLGFAPYNPSYAARPDNTGLTLLRYGAHVDVDLLGPLLSIPLDVNFFSDRERPGRGAERVRRHRRCHLDLHGRARSAGARRSRRA